jgi:hypothetical protein
MESKSDWIAVASADHVAIGRELGFMQVGHGKGAPLKRLHAGDRIGYYSPTRDSPTRDSPARDSPTRAMGSKDACQAFTAVGVVRDERIYQGDMMMQGKPDFHPFRRDVDWFDAYEAPIRPLLELLTFTRGKTNWGYVFRFGLIKITAEDMDLIVRAMRKRSDAD